MEYWQQYLESSSEKKMCGTLNQHGKPCSRVGPCPFPNPTAKPQQPKRGWTKEEHTKFLQGLKSCGRGNWKEISSIIGSKTPTQTQSHAQKYFLRQKQDKKNKRSIHDFSLADFEAEMKTSEDAKVMEETNISDVKQNETRADVPKREHKWINTEEPMDAIVTSPNKRFCLGNVHNIKGSLNFVESAMGTYLRDQNENRGYAVRYGMQTTQLNGIDHIETTLEPLLPSFLSGSGSFSLPLPKQTEEMRSKHSHHMKSNLVCPSNFFRSFNDS